MFVENEKTVSLERQLAHIWAEILGRDQIGVSDDFFELGGESLLALSMLGRLRTEWGIDVSVRTLFDSPVLADFARRIGFLRASVGAHEDAVEANAESD